MGGSCPCRRPRCSTQGIGRPHPPRWMGSCAILLFHFSHSTLFTIRQAGWGPEMCVTTRPLAWANMECTFGPALPADSVQNIGRNVPVGAAMCGGRPPLKYIANLNLQICALAHYLIHGRHRWRARSEVRRLPTNLFLRPELYSPLPNLPTP
jgi:hypothetical protein